MSNTIKISITFSFKGETFYPSITMDLDEQMKNTQTGMRAEQEIGRETLPASIYPLLAASIN